MVIVEFEVSWSMGKNNTSWIQRLSCNILFKNAFFLEVNKLPTQFPFRAKFPLHHLNLPKLPCTNVHSLEYWSWSIVLGQSPFVAFLGIFNSLRHYSWIYGQKNKKLPISYPNPTNMKVAKEEALDVVINVIEVDWKLNSRKRAFRQKWVGMKWRNQSGLEDLMCVILQYRHNFHDCSFGFSKQFLIIQIFEISYQFSYSILGRGNINVLMALSTITPSKFPPLLPFQPTGGSMC